jgi:hypothetical protein
MANLLSFDVYDIDLSKVMNNSNMNRNSLSRAIKLVVTALQTEDDRKGVLMIELRLGNKATPNTHLFLKNKNKK